MFATSLHAFPSPEQSPHPSGRTLGVRDWVTRWLSGFLEVGALVKRLDTGEGSYAVELEEDYRVYDALAQVSWASSGRLARLAWRILGGGGSRTVVCEVRLCGAGQLCVMLPRRHLYRPPAKRSPPSRWPTRRGVRSSGSNFCALTSSGRQTRPQPSRWAHGCCGLDPATHGNRRQPCAPGPLLDRLPNSLATHAQAFLEAEGVQQPNGNRTDPPLAKFEEQIQKYK